MTQLQQLPHGHLLQFLSDPNQDRVATYLSLLQARHYAPGTREGVIRTLKAFCVLLPQDRRSRISRDFTLTTPEDVDTWLEAAHHRGHAPATIHVRLNTVRRFFSFLLEDGQLPRHPIRRHRHQVTVPQHLPRPMTDDDVIAFFRVIDKLRDRLLFLLMLRCGLRVGEVHALPWDAINWEQSSIRIDNSKGAVDRVVYMSDDLESDLRQWQPLLSPEVRYIFPSRNKAKRLYLCIGYIQQLMIHYLKKAEIQSHYTCHSLRHTFATLLLNAGASLEVIKELMGHTSLDMTLRYAMLYETTKRQQYDQAMGELQRRYPLNGR